MNRYLCLRYFIYKIEAETRAQQKLVAEQTARLEQREQELNKREEAVILEKRSLSELKQRLDVEQSTMKTQTEEIKDKLMGIEHANESLKKEKEHLSQLYFELHALDGKNTGKLQQLQRSINNLRQTEEHMHTVNNLIHLYLIAKFSDTYCARELSGINLKHL